MATTLVLLVGLLLAASCGGRPGYNDAGHRTYRPASPRPPVDRALSIASYFDQSCNLISQEQLVRIKAITLGAGDPGGGIRGCSVAFEGTQTVAHAQVDLHRRVYQDIYSRSDEVAFFEPMIIAGRNTVRYDEIFFRPNECQIAVSLSDKTDESLVIVGNVERSKPVPGLGVCDETIKLTEAVIRTLEG